MTIAVDMGRKATKTNKQTNRDVTSNFVILRLCNEDDISLRFSVYLENSQRLYNLL